MYKVLVIDPRKEFEKIAQFRVEYKVTYDGQRYYKKNFNFFNKFDFVLCIHLGDPLNAYIMDKAKRFGCNTIAISDGVYEWENAYKNPKTLENGVKLYDPIPADFYFAIGAKNRYLNYINLVTMYPHTPLRIRVGMALAKASIMKDTLLITTAKTPYFNKSEFERLLTLIKAVYVNATEVYDQIIFRIFDKELLIALENEGITAKNLTKGSFGEVLDGVGAVVSTTSSVSYEVMARDIPLGHMDFRSSPLFCQSGWRLFLGADIKASLIEMQSRKPENMNYQRSEVLSLKGGIEYIDDIFDEIKCKHKSCNTPVIFQQNVLDSKWNINIKVLVKKILGKYVD